MDAKIAYFDASTPCNGCLASDHFLFNECSTQSTRALAGIVDLKGPFQSGERIFHAGQPPRGIYIVREGVVKCERVSVNGGLHVAGFYLSGEMFGGEDIGSDKHCYDAVALEKSWVCEISIARLEKLFIAHPDLQHCFLAHLSERIRASERILTDSFHVRAKHRLINFLCDFYTRLSERKQQMGTAIALPMNKCDIANHLGISAETLSRMLRELEEEKQIRNGIRTIELVDPERLACSRNSS